MYKPLSHINDQHVALAPFFSVKFMINTIIIIDFDIANFPFSDGDVPRRVSYGVYFSQLIRFTKVCNHVAE